MSRFYVGQRVRIKYSNGWPELAGQAGTIESTGGGKKNVYGMPTEWAVAPDCWGSCIAPRRGLHGGVRFGPSSDQLEPLTPPHEAGSWEVIERLLPNLRERVLESEAISELETETALLSLRQLRVAVPHPNHATRVVRVASTGE